MSENIVTLSYEGDEQSVSTTNVDFRKSNRKDDTTKPVLMRQPSKIKNNKDIDNVIETQDVAENLAVNSMDVNKYKSDPKVENKKSETNTNPKNVEMQTRNISSQVGRKRYDYKRSWQTILANALIKRSIRW